MADAQRESRDGFAGLAPSLVLVLSAGFALGMAVDAAAVLLLGIVCIGAVLRLYFVGELRWRHVVLASVPLGAWVVQFGIPWHVAPAIVLVAWVTWRRARAKIRADPESDVLRRPKADDVALGFVLAAAASGFMVWYAHEHIIFFPHISPVLVPLVALINALVEEIVFRDASFAVMRGAASWAKVFCSGLAFGVSHWSSGIPSGPVGVAAAAVFGWALAALYAKSKSLGLVVAVHCVVNIAMIVALTR